MKSCLFVRSTIEPPGSSGSARRRAMGCEDGGRVRPSRRIRCAPILVWRARAMHAARSSSVLLEGSGLDLGLVRLLADAPPTLFGHS